MNDLVDLRLHHHIAQEIYRQQMLQRLPGMLSFIFWLIKRILMNICMSQASVVFERCLFVHNKIEKNLILID